jgi:hypothetical protein
MTKSSSFWLNGYKTKIQNSAVDWDSFFRFGVNQPHALSPGRKASAL